LCAGVPEPLRVLFRVLGWESIAGLALFGCGGIVYAILLRRVPLNVAMSFTAAQFVGVIFAASLVLGEPVSPA
jgi:drug/metabolite transporter (DMT)-like permease